MVLLDFISFPAFEVFFLDDVRERGLEVGEFGGVEWLLGGVFSHGFGFAGDGLGGCGEAVFVCEIGCGVGGLDADFGGGGDGVLIGTEEEEVPVVVVCLVADAFLDILP